MRTKYLEFDSHKNSHRVDICLRWYKQILGNTVWFSDLIPEIYTIGRVTHWNANDFFSD